MLTGAQLPEAQKYSKTSCRVPVRRNTDQGPITWTLFPIAVVALAARLISKIPSLNPAFSFGWDDWLILASTIALIPADIGSQICGFTGRHPYSRSMADHIRSDRHRSWARHMDGISRQHHPDTLGKYDSKTPCFQLVGTDSTLTQCQALLCRRASLLIRCSCHQVVNPHLLPASLR